VNPIRHVGVIGTGAMGGGVVQSLVRAGITTFARDIDPAAQARAIVRGARGCATAADLARECDAIIVLVVDAPQIDTVLFGDNGVVAAAPPGTIVCASSTVDPAYPASIAPTLAARSIALLDAPVSGGPSKAAGGTMTMMVSGDAAAFARAEPMLAKITGRLFALGARAGDASTFKIVNNLLAGAHLAAAAEAIAIAIAAGIDVRTLAEIVNASSGASWMFADRVPRALANDFKPPRAAARMLTKDLAIAADVAARVGVDAPLARAALAAYGDAMDAGLGDDDDAVLVRRAAERAGIAWPFDAPTSDAPPDRRR
jgi:3-hydroxyisobutyrate dehydrogenase